jgi:hypothetical protein
MDKKQIDEISAAKLAVEEASTAYQTAVDRYRAAVNPTAEELERHLYERTDAEAFVDEDMLDEIVEHRDESEEEPEPSQAAGV